MISEHSEEGEDYHVEQRFKVLSGRGGQLRAAFVRRESAILCKIRIGSISRVNGPLQKANKELVVVG